jgi:hypothetical protein
MAGVTFQPIAGAIVVLKMLGKFLNYKKMIYF